MDSRLEEFSAITRGRDLIKTDEFAAALGKAPQTIRKLSCLHGAAYGVRPVRLPGSNRLLWPAREIAKLLTGGRAA